MGAKVMVVRVLIVVLVLCLVCPSASNAFGLLRYTFDAIANQLGLDRGPIPKAPPKTPPTGFHPQGPAPNAHPDANRIYIQAEGF
jgi:hypothetical protein